jgi:hypothetical protein
LVMIVESVFVLDASLYMDRLPVDKRWVKNRAGAASQ